MDDDTTSSNESGGEDTGAVDMSLGDSDNGNSSADDDKDDGASENDSGSNNGISKAKKDVDDDEESTSSEQDDDDDDGETSMRSKSSSAQTPKLLTSLTQPTKPSPNKMRIKLSLKLPTQANKKRVSLPTMKPKASAADPPQESDHDDEDGRNDVAMIVDSGETVDVVAVPTSPIHHASTKGASSSSASVFASTKKNLPISKAATGTASKRKSFQPSKRIRLPPIASPGLLMWRPSPHTGPKQAAAAAAIAAAAAATNTKHLSSQQIFETTMATAGYTAERRAHRPHRGSSVVKTVGDLFDTNVKLALHPTKLVPHDIWAAKKNNTSLPQLVERRLESCKRKRVPSKAGDGGSASKDHVKRYAPCRFRDMAPLSLSIPYPPEYIKKRLEYIQAVQTRETAIIQWQAAQERVEIAREEQEEAELQLAGSVGQSKTDISSTSTIHVNPVTIPPIPEPPEPPKISEMIAPSDDEDNPAASGSTLVPPYYYLKPGDAKESTELVSHLDQACFDIGDGRYFGLLTNRIADPNYCGPNAPGISVASVSGSGGGLATATTSTTTSTSGLSGGGMTMILSASFHSAAAVPPSKDGSATTKEKSGSTSKEGNKNEKSSTSALLSSTNGVAGSTTQGHGMTSKENTLTSSVPLTSQAKLRKVMESGGETANDMKKCIQVAVVKRMHSDKQDDDDCFTTADGVEYRELGKAFAAYGGVKACERCKSNKQGVYHCRVRRRHKEADYDGGNSLDTLAPIHDQLSSGSAEKATKDSTASVASTVVKPTIVEAVQDTTECTGSGQVVSDESAPPHKDSAGDMKTVDNMV